MNFFFFTQEELDPEDIRSIENRWNNDETSISIQTKDQGLNMSSSSETTVPINPPQQHETTPDTPPQTQTLLCSSDAQSLPAHEVPDPFIGAEPAPGPPAHAVTESQVSQSILQECEDNVRT